MEDMEDSVKVLSLFDGGDVGGFLDNANEMLIARGTGAVDARVDVSDVVTNGAEAEVGLDIAYSGSESFGIFVAGAENVEREALSAFGSYAGELFKLVDQARHGFGKFGHSLIHFQIGDRAPEAMSARCLLERGKVHGSFASLRMTPHY